jgi:DNA topoisomerase-3
MQNEEGRWRVEFDEPWAREGAKPPDEPAPAATAASAQTAASSEAA